jgi:hypothetical protein
MRSETFLLFKVACFFDNISNESTSTVVYGFENIFSIFFIETFAVPNFTGT